MIPKDRIKIRHEKKFASGIDVAIAGVVDSGSCNCLLHFWKKHLDGETGLLSIDMRQVESIDASSIAELCSLIRHRAALGQQTRIIAPPQMLAHTLYKVASLRDQGGVILEEPRDEEPYAG